MNDMTVSQAATVLTQVVEQATGQAVIAPITTPQDFVSVATTALKNGLDPVINAVSQMWSKTIYAYRPYQGFGTSLEMDLPRFSNALRKLSPIARGMVDDARFKWPTAYDAAQTQNPLGNGESVDMYKLAKQEVLQTNFYGTAVYEQEYTIFKDQFDVAFTSAEEFARFNAMNMQERANDRESYREAVARGIQANFIGAIIDEGKNERVVHLISEYNAESGQTLDAQSIYQPANYAPFMRWVYARIKTLARLMSARSQEFQTNITGKPVLRHTDAENLRIALYSKVFDQIESMVLSDTYNDEYLKLAAWESVPFWQEIGTPDSIAINPVYTHTDGTVKQGSTVEQAGILGIMHDRDALGYCYTNNWSALTPLNAKGGYWNEFQHATLKTIQDNTEKAIVLLLD